MTQGKCVKRKSWVEHESHFENISNFITIIMLSSSWPALQLPVARAAEQTNSNLLPFIDELRCNM